MIGAGLPFFGALPALFTLTEPLAANAELDAQAA
jgi:hypothetical protein